MPTYSYACTVCGHAFDIQQSFSDDSLTVCPECDGRLRKVFSSVGVVFKGSGFYRNDARAGSGKSSSIPAAPSSDSSSTPAAASTASAPASAPSAPSASAPAPATTKPAATA